MPTARPFALTLWRRAAFAAAAIAAFIAATSFIATRTTRACGPPPMPLRELYVTSDLVVVGSFGETTVVEMTEADAETSSESYLMRTELKVSSTVKGAGNHSALQVYHPGWKYEGVLTHRLEQQAESGKLLIFLRQREGGDGYETTDSAYSVKNLTDTALKTYLQRLDELALIMQQEEPDPARIVEWLVRCAEEPETRWEGLYELEMSNYALLSESQQAETDKNQETAELEVAAQEKGEANHAGGAAGVSGADDGKGTDSGPDDTSAEISSEEIVDLPAARGRFSVEPGSELIKLLTAEQKSRLANILFDTKTITYEEMPLINLVKHWKDPRLVPFLMSQLRSFTDDPPYQAGSLLVELAEILKDKELSKLAEKYNEHAVYEDPDPASADDETEAEEAASTNTGTEAAEEEVDEEQPVYGNSTQQRTIRLQRFIARAESVLVR